VTAHQTKHDLRAVGARFRVQGDFIEAAPYGSGHIHDTYASVYDQGGTRVRYIHQRINHGIFKDVPRMQKNIARVTEHIRQKLVAAESSEISRRVLTLVPTHAGDTFFRDEQGLYWRTYIFIEKAQTYDEVETTEQAYRAAMAFGRFQEQLSDPPSPQLLADLFFQCLLQYQLRPTPGRLSQRITAARNSLNDFLFHSLTRCYPLPHGVASFWGLLLTPLFLVIGGCTIFLFLQEL
jgi:hypothetical protein